MDLLTESKSCTYFLFSDIYSINSIHQDITKVNNQFSSLSSMRALSTFKVTLYGLWQSKSMQPHISVQPSISFLQLHPFEHPFFQLHLTRSMIAAGAGGTSVMTG